MHGIKGKIWLGGNDVILLPVVKSFLESMTVQYMGGQDVRGSQSREARATFLAYNTTVWGSSASVKQVGAIHPLHCSSFQASPLLTSITSEETEEPRSSTGFNSGSQPTVVQACRSPSCAALWFAHCFDFSLSGSSEVTVEDFTRLDDCLLGTLYHTEWKDRVMYYAGVIGMPLKIAIVAWFPTICSWK